MQHHPKRTCLSAQELSFYPALIKTLKQNPLFDKCDLSTLQVTAPIIKKPRPPRIPRIQNINRLIANIEENVKNNSHLIIHHDGKLFIRKTYLAQVMKVAPLTLKKWLRLGFIKRSSSKYDNWEIYHVDSIIEQLKNQRYSK